MQNEILLRNSLKHAQNCRVSKGPQRKGHRGGTLEKGLTEEVKED
jgi:hypothetical protein